MQAEGSAPRRGRPRTRTDDVLRDAVIAVAYRTFLELGYGAATTDEIAARARISKQTLYRVFSSKSDLFAAVAAAHRPSMMALPCPDDDRPLPEALAAIFHADIEEVADLERKRLIHLVIRESHVFPELHRAIVDHGVRRSRAELAEWLARRSARGDFPSVDFERHAALLMDMIFGFGGEDPHETIDLAGRRPHGGHVRWCIDIFLNGVLPR